MILLNLPYAPSVNTYWRRGRFSTYLSPVGREFKKAVAEYIVESNTPKLGDARVRITMVIRPRSKRKFDIDNLAKSVLDAISQEGAGVIDDDEQVDELHIIRGDPIKGGKIVVTIEVLDGDT
jgi:crossover junction endodeoxyribonuclease RusA